MSNGVAACNFSSLLGMRRSALAVSNSGAGQSQTWTATVFSNGGVAFVGSPWAVTNGCIAAGAVDELANLLFLASRCA